MSELGSLSKSWDQAEAAMRLAIGYKQIGAYNQALKMRLEGIRYANEALARAVTVNPVLASKVSKEIDFAIIDAIDLLATIEKEQG